MENPNLVRWLSGVEQYRKGKAAMEVERAPGKGCQEQYRRQKKAVWKVEKAPEEECQKQGRRKGGYGSEKAPEGGCQGQYRNQKKGSNGSNKGTMPVT